MNVQTKPAGKATRSKLLQAAFDEMYCQGYQGMRIDKILERTGLTKGAFYHYFPGKKALGYAVVEEKINDIINELWLKPLVENDDPIQAIATIGERAAETLGEEFVRLGCPLNNLSQEMSPVDEGFRERLEHIFKSWAGMIAGALMAGQKNGYISKDIQVAEAAIFIIAALEGCISLAKNGQDASVFAAGMSQIERYLETLRA